MALTVNRRIMVRPNVFLCLVSLLVLEAFVPSLTPQHFGTVYRTFRLLEFVVALWLLTPWWGRRDLLLVRYHLTALSVILGSVLLGVLVAPGRALARGGSAACSGLSRPRRSRTTRRLPSGWWSCSGSAGHVRGRVTLIVVTCGHDTAPHAHQDRPRRHDRRLPGRGMSLIVAKAAGTQAVRRPSVPSRRSPS